MSRPTKHARKLEGRWIRCLDEKTDLLIVRCFHCNTLQAALRVTVQNLLQHLSVEVSRMSSQETAKKSPEAARSAQRKARRLRRKARRLQREARRPQRKTRRLQRKARRLQRKAHVHCKLRRILLSPSFDVRLAVMPCNPAVF